MVVIGTNTKVKGEFQTDIENFANYVSVKYHLNDLVV